MARKQQHNKQQVKFTGVGHHVEAANMTVTCAVEAARQRGALDAHDMNGMSEADRRQYVRLARVEFGIVDWAREA